jgi:hypothetical protein
MPLVSPNARTAVQQLRASKIREVANAGMERKDVAAFWFGEPDEVTPDFIRQAAVDALAAGDTFYTHNLGIPELRQAIAAYTTRLHRPTSIDQIAVTNSGMSALMISAQAIAGPGDRVVAVTPLWPNLVEIPKILGAQVETVALQFTSSGWQLDVVRLLDALRPGHPRGADQLAEQPHGLDHRAREPASDPRALPASRDLDHRRTMPMSGCISAILRPAPMHRLRRRFSISPKTRIASSAPTRSRKPGS